MTKAEHDRIMTKMERAEENRRRLLLEGLSRKTVAENTADDLAVKPKNKTGKK